MRLIYLQANQAWMFVFGEDPVRIHDYPMFFTLRGDAVMVASIARLMVSKDGAVSAMPSPSLPVASC